MQPIFLNKNFSKFCDFFSEKMRIFWQNIIFFNFLIFPFWAKILHPQKKSRCLFKGVCLPYTKCSQSWPFILCHFFGLIPGKYLLDTLSISQKCFLGRKSCRFSNALGVREFRSECTFARTSGRHLLGPYPTHKALIGISF